MNQANNRGLFLYQTLDSTQLSIMDKIRDNIPVDIKKIIKRMEIELREDILPTDVSGAVRKEDNGQITIYCDITEDEARQRFTMAHELAHFLLGHLDNNLYISDNILLRSSKMTNTQERDANYLAAEILMPMEKIDHITDTQSLGIGELAKILNVSEQALSIRLGIT